MIVRVDTIRDELEVFVMNTAVAATRLIEPFKVLGRYLVIVPHELVRVAAITDIVRIRRPGGIEVIALNSSLYVYADQEELKL